VKTWKSNAGRLYITKMTDEHLLNALNFMLRRAGKKHNAFDSIAVEIRRRGLALPKHRWLGTAGVGEAVMARRFQEAAATIDSDVTPEVFKEVMDDLAGVCQTCYGVVFKGECLNCGRKVQIEK